MTQGRHARDWSKALTAATPQTRELATAIQLERQYSIARLAGGDSSRLPQARARADAILGILDKVDASYSRSGHSDMSGDIGGIHTAEARLSFVRAQIDSRALPLADIDSFYSHFLDAISVGSELVEAGAPTPAVASAVATALSIVAVSEMLSRSTALGSVLANDETLPPPLAVEFARLVGGYRAGLESLAARSTAVEPVMKSPAWSRLVPMENTLLARAVDPITAAPVKSGSESPPAPMSFTPADWTGVSGEANNALLELWDQQMRHAHGLAEQAADRSARNGIVVGSALLIAAVVAFVISLLMANRIIARLKGLRDQTLALASERLPQIMRRLRSGDNLGEGVELSPLAFGTDEIGQVADAFNRAQSAAVAAAVTEARTREGVRTVFLNIAHRSQMVVHRQLEILDEAESGQEDPAMLDIFFRLDHLTTRERRNAENLIILAGGEPGRRWRNPVQLVEIVRSGVSEAVDFSRVKTMRLPEAMITGSSVADLVHLLAELIDNAANFSPPQSQVEIRGSVVGKGVAVEVVDQGMGMAEGELARINAMLLEPPDFGLGTLTEDSRLGVFVVAQLARRNDVTVRLVESEYGGIRAIVVIPSKLIVTEPGSIQEAWESQTEPARATVMASVDSPETVVFPASGASASIEQMWDAARHRAPDVTFGSFADRGAPAAMAGLVADDRPSLPRRRRQASLAPQLARDHEEAEAASQPSRTAEQARDLMSAIENGTRQGRQARPGGFGVGTPRS